MDEKELKAMQNSLQGRFTKLSKSFGKGLVNAIKGGGIAGIALGLIDKLLNPLKEIQDAIDNTLKASDDLATNAAQFNTSSGKLFKLVSLAKATGLDPSQLYMQITKFQTAVAQAKADPNDKSVSSVRNFTKNEDIAQSFFDFISQLQKMDTTQRTLVQQQVFGEKQILKMADFLQADFSKLGKLTGIDKVSSSKLSKDTNKLAGLNDLADALAVNREVKDVQRKAAIINEGMIRSFDKTEKIRNENLNRNITNYENLATITQTMEKINGMIQEGVSALGSLVAKVIPLADKVMGFIDYFRGSPAARAVNGVVKGTLFGRKTTWNGGK